MTHQTTRPNMLRSLAERAATHPRIEAAVMGAIRGVLPAVLEQLIAEEAERQGSHVLRMYPRRAPSEMRETRDANVRAMLAGGVAPELVAVQVGCSRAHVYRVQAHMRRQSQPQP